MKTIGLLGGMSWESTATYYRLINEGVKESLGGLHSAKIAMVSVDFADIEALQMAGNWDEAGRQLALAANQIEAAGADFIVICTNTMHKVAPAIMDSVSIPLLHIADATAADINARGYSKVALLGTAFTMEQDFYKGRLKDKFGIEVITPGASDRKIIHDVIYDELCLGTIKDTSRAEYLRIVDSLNQQGTEAIILGCTEIGLLITPEHTDVPLLDTTIIHAEAAVRHAVEGL